MYAALNLIIKKIPVTNSKVTLGYTWSRLLS